MRQNLRRTVEKISKFPGRIYRGKLAESYDGIGQYVLVSLAQASVAGAYKARVASGDFGGGRTFPVGTPVVVISHRGQLEVHLGNLAGCVVGDKFNREVPLQIPDTWGNCKYGKWLNGYEMMEYGDWTGYELWDDHNYVTDGEGIISYNFASSIGEDPSMGLKFPSGLKLPFDLEFKVRFGDHLLTPISQFTSGVLQLYLGHSHHRDYNSWFTYTFALETFDNTNWTSVSINSQNPWIWPEWTDDFAVTDVPISEADFVKQYQIKGRYASDGFFFKHWVVGESEPTDWLTYAKFVNPPDPGNLRLLYWESQSFDTAGTGTEDNVEVPMYIDDVKICPMPKERSQRVALHPYP